MLAAPVVAPVPRCTTADLQVTLGRGGAAAGTVERPVFFRNRSGRACFVFGYAGFGLENAARKVQASHVIWGPTFAISTKPHRVVLQAGQRAETVLAWSDVPHPGESQKYPCQPKSAWLEVTPPDEPAFVRLPFGEVVCNRGTLRTPALRAVG
jgi:Protein of unknown function (DUF4232)